jgi:predicted GNAT superfamily acetyltransferase
MIIRALHTIPEFRDIVALEQDIWGYGDPEDGVGIPMFIITVKHGGILLGAYDGDRLIGFVYSIAGLKHGRPMQWSHMLGVRPEYRGAGIGRDLKLEQRRLSLEMGIDLMEWTFDPLVAINAHLNFRRLGVVVDEYALNVYGDSSSPLHKGAPTDRFIAQWWMRSSRVEAALDGAASPTPPPSAPVFPGVARVNTVERRGDWLACAGYDAARTDRELVTIIPAGFNDMLHRQPSLAHEWRMASREIFGGYLSRGYRVVDFSFLPGSGEGAYLLQADAAGA